MSFSVPSAAALDPIQTSELPPLLQASEFQSLKQHLPSELADTDYDTHYNLGIAYKEMGMLDDASRELSLSAGSPAYKISSLTLLGQCKMDAGKPPKHWRPTSKHCTVKISTATSKSHCTTK